MANIAPAAKNMYKASAEDPRRMFETAIAQIRDIQAPSDVSKVPIAVHRRPQDDVTMEKRALTDAARALAQLWRLPQPCR